MLLGLSDAGMKAILGTGGLARRCRERAPGGWDFWSSKLEGTGGVEDRRREGSQGGGDNYGIQCSFAAADNAMAFCASSLTALILAFALALAAVLAFALGAFPIAKPQWR